MGVSVTRYVKFIRKGDRGNSVITAVTSIRRYTLATWQRIGATNYAFTWANISNASDMKIGDTMVIQGVITDKNDISVTYYGTVATISGASVKTIATTLIMSGTNGSSFAAHYSIDGETNWHDTFTDGDIYMRTSADSGKTWSAAIRIVGEKGDETNYQFGWSSHKSLDDSEDPLSDIVDWYDYPPKRTDASKPYLWTMITTPDGRVSYARLTGEKGDNGRDAVTIYIDPNIILHKKATSNSTYAVTVRLKEGEKYIGYGNNFGEFLSTKPTSTLPTGLNWSCITNTDNIVHYFTITTNSVVNTNVTITIKYKGIDYTRSIPIKTVADGEPGGPGGTGPKGDRGPALRGPQMWNDCSVGYVFQSGADGEEYKDVVLYNNNYYSCVKSHAKTANNAPLSTADTTNGYWKLADKFEIIATKILLAQYALVKNLGVETIEMKDKNDSIIFQAKGGKVICNSGTFNNITVKGNSTFEGSVKANMFYGTVKKVTPGSTYQIDPVNEPYNFYYVENPTKRTFIVLPKAANYEGLEINVFTKLSASSSLSYRTIVKAQNNDDLYVKQNAAIVSSDIAVEKINVGYTNFKNDSITTASNSYIRFKCIGGAWYAISGQFTGE